MDLLVLRYIQPEFLVGPISTKRFLCVYACIYFCIQLGKT